MDKSDLKKILITGGKGSIGSLMTPFLVGTGHEVTQYDRVLGDDIFDLSALAQAMEGQDALIHLVAIPHPGVRGCTEADYWKLNVESLKSTFKLAAEAGVKRVVFPSTGCVYGFWGGHAKPDQFPIVEESPKPSRQEGLTVYGETKLACEAFLAEESEKAGIRSTAFRIESIGFLPTALSMYDMFDGYGTLSEATCAAYHMLASSSVENFHQALHLALHHEVDYWFRTFNIVNDYVHWSIDAQRFAEENYPGVPIHTQGNQSLCSNAAAKEHLGYRPYPVAGCYADRIAVARAMGELRPGPKDHVLNAAKFCVKKALTTYNQLMK